MKGSIKLFNIFGIAIDIHITFLILPLIFGFYEGLRGVFFVVLVFVCVTMHEITHSLVARRFGVKVRNITLLPIGGIAAMGSIPEKPRQEFLISLAGPMFNFALAVVLFYPLYRILGADVLFAEPTMKSWPGVIAYAYWINPFLALFNLLPAFPMDGGRILRSILARGMDYRKATKIAVACGHTFAFIFVFIGLTRSHLPLAIIGVFIYLAASQEEVEVDVRATLRRFYVRDVLRRDFKSVAPDTALKRVIEAMFRSHQEDFPVIENGELLGMLTRADIINGIHQYGMERTARESMRADFPVARVNSALTDVQSKMQESDLKALPIVNEEGKIAGLITLEDISRVYFLVGKMK